MIVQIVLIYK